jgi:NTP pyrophosphatase (non-canonical NTP hydrolase)
MSHDFLSETAAEVLRAREQHPNPQDPLLLALIEEVGEVAKAIHDESWNRVIEECVQAAAMLFRLATEGDRTLDKFRLSKKLDLPMRNEKTRGGLPIPPEGFQWHKKGGWTPDMFTEGHRPLLINEVVGQEDEWFDGTRWRGVPASAVGKPVLYGVRHHRTLRGFSTAEIPGEVDSIPERLETPEAPWGDTIRELRERLQGTAITQINTHIRIGHPNPPKGYIERTQMLLRRLRDGKGTDGIPPLSEQSIPMEMAREIFQTAKTEDADRFKLWWEGRNQGLCSMQDVLWGWTAGCAFLREILREHAMEAGVAVAAVGELLPGEPIPFDLSRALAGEAVITRDNQHVTDVRYEPEGSGDEYPVCGKIQEEGVECFWTVNGEYYSERDQDHRINMQHFDLFMQHPRVEVIPLPEDASQ